jgi:iron complex transport system substrate-binding protein
MMPYLRLATLLGLLILPFTSQAASQRVIGVGGAVTEIIYALGAEGQLVAVDSSSIYPAEARKLPQVGYLRQISVEGVASLRPDVVIGAHDIGPASAVEKLRSLGIPLVIAQKAEDIDSAAERIRLVGHTLGLDAQAQQLAAKVAAKARQNSAAFNNLPGEKPAVVLFLGYGGRSPLIAGGHTSGDAMIRLAGGRNVFTEVTGYKAVNGEALIAARPQVAIMTRQSLEQAGSIEAAISTIPGLDQTPAGKNQRIVVMDIMEMLGFGPRLPDAIQTLGEGIHEHEQTAQNKTAETHPQSEPVAATQP